jgi:hypothetical protein
MTALPPSLAYPFRARLPDLRPDGAPARLLLRPLPHRRARAAPRQMPSGRPVHRRSLRRLHVRPSPRTWRDQRSAATTWPAHGRVRAPDRRPRQEARVSAPARGVPVPPPRMGRGSLVRQAVPTRRQILCGSTGAHGSGIADRSYERCSTSSSPIENGASGPGQSADSPRSSCGGRGASVKVRASSTTCTLASGRSRSSARSGAK